MVLGLVKPLFLVEEKDKYFSRMYFSTMVIPHRPKRFVVGAIPKKKFFFKNLK